MEEMGLITLSKKIIQRFQIDKPSIALKKMFYDFFTRERAKHFGSENIDKTIYIIRGIDYKSPFCVAPVLNLLANYFYVVSHVFYAKQNGWIPVVDQLNYPEYNTMDYPINGTMNSWEYFWKQPSDITLEEAYRSRNVILSRRNFLAQWDIGYDIKNYYDSELINEYNAVTQLFPINDQTFEYIQIAKQRLPTDKKILGVNVRISGHSEKAEIHGSGHPIQPDVYDLIEIVKDRVAEWNMDLIFVASDTEFAIRAFKDEFGNKVIFSDRRRAELGKEYDLDRNKKMYLKTNIYQTTLDYLCEMELLSSCNALLGSISSGFRYVVVRNNGRFEHLEILDYGSFEMAKNINRNKLMV